MDYPLFSFRREGLPDPERPGPLYSFARWLHCHGDGPERGRRLLCAHSARRYELRSGEDGNYSCLARARIGPETPGARHSARTRVESQASVPGNEQQIGAGDSTLRITRVSKSPCRTRNSFALSTGRRVHGAASGLDLSPPGETLHILIRWGVGWVGLTQ